MAEKKVSLSQIAEEMGLDPKTVRAILRRGDYKRPGTRWAWPVGEKAAVKAMIRAGQRKPKQEKKAPAKRKRGVTHIDVNETSVRH